MIMFFGYFVGVALVGAGIGALSVHMIWSRLGTDPHAFVVILAAVAGAAAAMALQRYVIIIATAFAGGWTMLWGAMQFSDWSRRHLRAVARCGWCIRSICRQAPVGAGSRGWRSGLLGVFIQLRFTGRVKGAGPREGRSRKLDNTVVPASAGRIT